jgi:hypothetical protein
MYVLGTYVFYCIFGQVLFKVYDYGHFSSICHCMGQDPCRARCHERILPTLFDAVVSVHSAQVPCCVQVYFPQKDVLLKCNFLD